MKKFTFLIFALALSVPQAWAIPQSFRVFNGNFFGPVIPATPRFNADLTEEFLLPDKWAKNEFSGPWEEEPAFTGQEVKRMTANPILFGAVPYSVQAFTEEKELRQLAITYLDAGAFFGFNFGGENTYVERKVGSEKRSEFNHLYNKLSKSLRDRLDEGCGRGEMNVIGRSHMLRTAFTDYKWEGFVLRLALRQGHSVSLHIMREGEEMDSFLDQNLAPLTEKQRGQILMQNVTSNERGDVLIDNIPMFDQGYTPFCGIHSLAMVGRYYGLRMGADGLAAGAEFRNTGSARGSRVLDLYHAAAEEVGMDVSVTSRFDIKRIRKAVEAGMPVVVWRRVTKEREEFHTEFASKLQRNSDAKLPAATKARREEWPERKKKGSPSHASVISGINDERGEIIFTDPWGEEARNRRMLIEEMEATAYAVFYFRF